MSEQTPYERMRNACMNIVEEIAASIMDGNEPYYALHDVLNMAKWAALDKEKADEIAAEAVKEATMQAIMKKIDEISLDSQ